MTRNFKDEYKAIQPSLNKALSELKRLIKTQLRKIDNPRLVRIRLTEGRIKTIESLLSKAKKNKWKQKDILRKARDIIGVRIVCANIEDIRRIKELLVSNPRLNDIPQLEEDRILFPTSSGYRDFKFYVSYGTGDNTCPNITCEIQIRTMLQDSWATLAHKDIYKEGTDLPASLKKLSFRLSELLHVADQIAQDIRDEVSQKREPLKRGDNKVTEDTLTLAYKKAFNKLPSDYMIRSTKNKCDERGITNIRSIEEALLSKKNRSQLANAYRQATGWEIYEDIIFQFSPLIATYGIEIAVDAVTKQGIHEWEDSDRIYRSELKSELPASFDDFLEYLEPHKKDDYVDFPDRIYRLAEALHAIKECSVCGAPIVDEEIFSQNAQDHYGIEDIKGQIESLILSSGADIGDGMLCSYHVYHKDDD